MDFVEYEGKAILAAAGLPVLEGVLCTTVDAVIAAVEKLGPSAIKAQVPIGKRGKAGGIKLVDDIDSARSAAQQILSMDISGYRVDAVLVEQKAPIQREFYAAVMNDMGSRSPCILFSAEGGMDIEELADERPEAIGRIPVAIEQGVDRAVVERVLVDIGLADHAERIADLLAQLYRLYLETDAELVEINPLAMLDDGSLRVLDCKLRVDDAAAYRQAAHVEHSAPEPLTEMEKRGADLGIKFIELDGSVGLLANGAGLTMTTMDVISHYGGRPANFMEIGGEAYTKATPALELVLSNPRVKSLIVNFCGAFARTDVMTEGVIEAWEALKPQIPVFFSIHGTGEDEAVEMLRSRLDIQPFDHMEDAVQAAVESSR